MLPTLYAYDKNKNQLQWSVTTDGDKVIVTHGRVGGKLQTQVTTCKGKNIGKSNETTPQEQAILEAQSKWNYQVKCEDYNENIALSGLQLRPMLALDYNKVSHRVDWKQAMVQPKLDGLRLTIGYRTKDSHETEMMSRKGETYHVEHLHNDALILLQKVNDILPAGITCEALDGEAYLHGLSLQEITSRCRKYQKGLTEEIQFHVFDLVIEGMPFYLRLKYLQKAFSESSIRRVFPVQTYWCCDEKFMNELHGSFTQEGYEGTMIRLSNSMYEIDQRGSGLFKYKEFQDMECLITAVWSDNNGNAMLTCRMKDGGVFDCTPKRTHKERKEMLDNKLDLIGQWITVKYQALTEDGLPQFPIGLGLRECDDNGQPVY